MGKTLFHFTFGETSTLRATVGRSPSPAPGKKENTRRRSDAGRLEEVVLLSTQITGGKVGVGRLQGVQEPAF